MLVQLLSSAKGPTRSRCHDRSSASAPAARSRSSGLGSSASNSSASATSSCPSTPTTKSSLRSRQRIWHRLISGGAVRLQYQPFNSPFSSQTLNTLNQASR
ncbi:MAG: hypothetical protein J7M15_07090 [Anaerolineae bacterium]|nr:hypothetical protein [Anaerolineae bacterium]